jgi:hypothetical protein
MNYELHVYTLEDIRSLEWYLVEAGSNTSTVVLRVVGGDEKGTEFLGA